MTVERIVVVKPSIATLNWTTEALQEAVPAMNGGFWITTTHGDIRVNAGPVAEEIAAAVRSILVEAAKGALPAHALTQEQLEFLGYEFLPADLLPGHWIWRDDYRSAIRPLGSLEEAVADAWQTLVDLLAAITPPKQVAYSGSAAIGGKRIEVEFEAPEGASKAISDAAFLNALAQKVDINYLPIGTV